MSPLFPSPISLADIKSQVISFPSKTLFHAQSFLKTELELSLKSIF